GEAAGGRRGARLALQEALERYGAQRTVRDDDELAAGDPVLDRGQQLAVQLVRDPEAGGFVPLHDRPVQVREVGRERRLAGDAGDGEILRRDGEDEDLPPAQEVLDENRPLVEDARLD